MKDVNSINLEVNPTQISFIEATIERFLSYGVLDFDADARDASIKAVSALIFAIGKQFNQKINYSIETGRNDLI